MTSPFRTNTSLGPNLSQVVKASTTGGVWYDGPRQIVSPQLGDTAMGDDGHLYVFVKATGTITVGAAPGTAVVLTEPAMTVASGAGAFNAPHTGFYSGTLVAGDCFWVRKTAM